MTAQFVTLDFESMHESSSENSLKPLGKVVCLRCGRPLTNEKSRQAHLGPKCARKLVYETRTKSYSLGTLKCSKRIRESSTQRDALPTQDISLYYSVNSSQKPYCRAGIVFLPITDSCTPDEYNYRKKTYSLPLLEGVIYEISVCLPQVRRFLLQVKDQQFRDINYSIK